MVNKVVYIKNRACDNVWYKKHNTHTHILIHQKMVAMTYEE